MANPYNQQADDEYLSDLSSGLGIYKGVKQGGAVGDVKAGASATKLGASTGVFGSASGTIGGAAADLSNIAGIYTGLEKGGVAGYGTAAVNAGQLGLRSAGMSATIGSSAAADALGVAGGALAVYNFAENWQSGKTGQDALQGAQAGAAIGAEFGGIGAIPGAVIGAAVGAISSIFGPGAKDPENVGWDQYAKAYQSNGAAGVAGASPANNYQMLAGIFDARGSSIPFYQKYGRMGEGQFTTDMATQINSAIASGKIQANAPPSQIYNQVVEPWINSMAPGGWKNTNTSQGAPEKAAVGNMLTSLIGQYQSGQLTSKSQVGIDGQTIPNLPAYNAAGNTAQAKQAQQQTAAATKAVSAALTPAVASFGTSGASSTSISTALAGTAALGLGATMAGNQFSNATPTSNLYTPTAPGSAQAGMASGGAAVTDSGAGAASGPVAAAGDTSSSSSFLSDIAGFLGSPVGNMAEFATLGGVGIAEANSQKSTNDQLASSLATPGQPFSAAGAGELSQLTGGPQMGGPMGASVAQQTAAAKELGTVATTYGTGALDPAQTQQVKDFVAQQRAQVNSELAATGNTDTNSDAYRTRYQQIDEQAAQMTQQLQQGNISTASGALTAVQNTYNGLLNQALSSSEFGFSTDLAAVTTQIQSDTQLAGQLQSLFAAIAQGFGTAMSGGNKGSGNAAGAVAGAAGQVAKAIGGVGGSASGGGSGVSQQDMQSTEVAAENAGDVADQGYSLSADQSVSDSAFNTSLSNDASLQAYADQGISDFGGDPFGG